MMPKRLNDQIPAFFRFCTGGDAIVSWYNSINDPHSHLFRIGLTSDGAVLLWVMALVGAAVVLDVLLNDWTPKVLCFGQKCYPLHWRRAFRYRHLLFVALAFCYAAQPYVAEKGGYGVSLLIFFYWNSFQNIAIAFSDARQRSRSQGWQRACS